MVRQEHMNEIVDSWLRHAEQGAMLGLADTTQREAIIVGRRLRSCAGKATAGRVYRLDIMECNLTTARAQVRHVRVGHDDAGMRLDNYLLRTFRNVPKSRIYKIIRSGEVRINSARVKPGTRLAEDDEVRLPPVRQQHASPGRPPDTLLARVNNALVHETPDYLLFNKPAGLAVHAGSGLRFGLIEVLRAARSHDYLELVHRLDRQTSGCLLVARSRGALDGLRAALNAPSARKRYLALVEGRWRHGTVEIDAPLSRDNERSGERMVEIDHAGGRACLSLFEPLAVYRDASLMAVEIRTGRTHQIRVHAAYMGHPVSADGKYGPNGRAGIWRQRGLDRMFLHAQRLQLEYAGAAIDCRAALPDTLQRVLDGLDQS